MTETVSFVVTFDRELGAVVVLTFADDCVSRPVQ